ncbi:Methylmalonic aciduria and homocystinuria type D-like protein, mitochondrial [Aphelenchoides bicaudatus]|nr:Methylmalonic aciduria and homocystinuria type D-like protein, mitochondrial [Aphelenchoides bicaudatus]
MRLPIRTLNNISSVRHFSSNYRTQKITISSIFDNTESTPRTNILLGNCKEYPFNGQVTCEALNPKFVTNRVDEKKKPRVYYYTFNVNHFLAFPVIKNESYIPKPDVNEVCRWNAKIELVAIKCPLILRKDLQKLFPTANIKKSQITLINFYEIVEDNVEEEHISLMEKADSFVLAANSVCVTLRNEGFWADFVDPHSSQSRLDNQSFKRLMNRSENYDFTGIKMTDENGCNIVEQVSLHKTPFIGSVFTTASQYSDVVQQIINSGD